MISTLLDGIELVNDTRYLTAVKREEHTCGVL
jgi:hypothetical protein